MGDLCLLHDGGHPTDHGDGPGEHVHIDDELGNDPDVVDLSPDVLHAAHIDHQEVADPDQKDHQREKECLGLIEGDVPVLAGYGQVGEGSGGEGLYAVGLDHVDAREGLLGKGGEPGEVLLHDVAALIDHPAQKIDRNRKHGQGQEGVERELGVDAGHVRDGHNEEHQHVHGVHDGRAKVHPDLTDVLADPVHQVARSVALVEIQREGLVLAEDLVLQVKLDQARHDDERLPHHEGEEAREQGCTYDQQDVDQELRLDDVQIRDPVVVVILHHVERIADQLGDLQGEYLRDHRDQEAEEKAVPVF